MLIAASGCAYLKIRLASKLSLMMVFIALVVYTNPVDVLLSSEPISAAGGLGWVALRSWEHSYGWDRGCSHIHQCRCTYTQVVPTAQHRARTFLLRSLCMLFRHSRCQQIDVKAGEEGILQQCWKLFRKMLTQRTSVVLTKNVQPFHARFSGSFAASGYK